MDIGSILNVNEPAPGSSPGGPAVDASAPTKPGGDLMSQWNAFLAKPGNMAAVMSAGLAMMQPVGVGQSTIGHIARAIGQGAEAKQAQAKTESEQNLQSAQAEYYSGRAANLPGTGLSAAQQAIQSRADVVLYNNIVKQIWSGEDPVDPMGAMARAESENPELFAQKMHEVEVAFSTLKKAAGGPTAVAPAIGGAAPASRTPTPQDIQYLKAHPEMKVNFDKTFGPGAAARAGVT